MPKYITVKRGFFICAGMETPVPLNIYLVLVWDLSLIDI